MLLLEKSGTRESKIKNKTKNNWAEDNYKRYKIVT